MPVRFGMDFLTVLDAGASRGQFALFASARYPRAKLICFEPLPESCALLRRVTAGRDVEIHAVALGARGEDRDLNVSAQDDSSSLLPIGPRQVSEFPGTQRARTIPVAVRPLDEYVPADLRRPALLKIDVQGFELEVLKGASRALDSIDAVFVECSFSELYTGQATVGAVIQLLAERGFRLVDIYGLIRDASGAALQGDFLFRRDGARSVD
jgi:FkbM family methyltransferase